MAIISDNINLHVNIAYFKYRSQRVYFSLVFILQGRGVS